MGDGFRPNLMLLKKPGSNSAHSPGQPLSTSSMEAAARPASQMQCELKLTRDPMRELDLIYGSDLHL
jgi:hypothetical protein